MQLTGAGDREVFVTSEIYDRKLRICCLSLNSGSTKLQPTVEEMSGDAKWAVLSGCSAIRHGTDTQVTRLFWKEPIVDTLALARRGETTRSPVTDWVLWSRHLESRLHRAEGST